MGITAEDLENRFTHHPPKGDQVERYKKIRDKAHELAFHIWCVTPESDEQKLSIVKLEECVMHANSAIARNE